MFEKSLALLATHHYHCVGMIPSFIDINGIWDILPSGIHDAALAEVKARFATNRRREALYRGFADGVGSLRDAGCKVVYLDGSFVSAKPNPGDFDACWEPEGVVVKDLDPVLLDFSQGRKNQKAKFGGEFFLSSGSADGTLTFLEYFQTDRHTGQAKGIIRIRLSLGDRGVAQT